MSRSISLFALSATMLAAAAGNASAQAIDFGGLHHNPVGGAILTPTTDGSLLVEHLGSASSGVDVLCETQSGMGTTCDLAELFRSPGSTVRHRYKGWDGTIKGRLEMRCGAPGTCNTICDFSTLTDATGGSVRSLHWIVRDLIGNELASGDITGPTASFIVIPPPPMSPAGVSQPSLWNMRTRVNELEATLKNFGILARCTTGHFTVTGLNATPIEFASSVEVFPIMCITSPCPGGWNDVSSVSVSANGLPSQSLRMHTPEITRWRSPDLVCGDTSHFRSIPCVGLGTCSMIEGCDMPPPIACAPVDTSLHISNIGSSGQDGVSIRFSDSESYRSGIVHRDIATFAGEARVVCTETPGAIGQVHADWQSPLDYGHVTVLKLSCTPSSSIGGAMVFADATGQGSPTCIVECIDASGAVIASAVCTPTQGVLNLQPFGGDTVFHSSCDAFGVGSVRCPSGECILPDGRRISGVVATSFKPSVGEKRFQSISRCNITASGLSSLSVDNIDYTPSAIVGGLACVPVGGSCLAASDGTLVISSPPGATSGGASIVTNSDMEGAVAFDLQQLISSGGTARIRRRGWDGLIYHRLSLSSPPGSGQVIEENDFSGLGVSGFDWKLRGQDGAVLAQGAHSGEVISWALTPSASGGSIDKLYATGGSSGRSASEGFFDVAMTVSGLATTPVAGVHSIELDPVECFGCPPPVGQSSSLEIETVGMSSFAVNTVGLSASGFIRWSGTEFEGIAGGLGSARVKVVKTSTGPTLPVQNIGSSGQDGVEIKHFETGDIPTQEQFYNLIESYRSSGWGGGGAGGSFVAAEFRAACPACVDGHVTVLKLHETRENGFSWYTPDFSSIGASGYECAVYNQFGTLIDSFVSLSDDRFATPICDGPVKVSCDSTGQVSFQPCSPVCITPDGSTLSNVARMTFRPIAPTQSFGGPSTFRLTGRSLETMTVLSSEVASCPGDFNRDGGVDGDDVIIFFGYWDSGDIAGDFNGDGGVDGDDVIQFFEHWDSGC